MISIVITSYREPKTIGRAIKSFQNQKIKDKYEIIVVAPDKETLNVAKKYKVKCFKDPRKGKPTALNLAFSKAKGNIVVLSDGDVYVNGNSVNNLLRHFKNKKVGAVTGRPVALDNKKTLFGYWAHLLNNSAHIERLRRDRKSLPMFCTGYIFAIRKELCENLPEDVLDDAYISMLVLKKGFEIKYEPKAIAYIKNATNLKDWINQKRRNSMGHNHARQLLGNMIKMKSFSNEIFYGWYKALNYPKTLKELFYTKLLFPVRLYVWLLSFYDKFKERKVMDVWKRIESTK